MCFSAEADLFAGGLIGAVGVATLAQVRSPRTALLASLPLLFAGHQLTESLVWMGQDGRLAPGATHAAVVAFMLYAQAILPFLMGLAVFLVEPPGRRRWAIAALTLVGAGLCVWAGRAVLIGPDTAVVQGRCLAFRNPTTNHPWVVAIYALPACAAPLLSSRSRVRLFGAVTFAGMAAVLAVKAYALTSVWCLYAALASVALFFAVRRLERTPLLDSPAARAWTPRAAAQRSSAP